MQDAANNTENANPSTDDSDADAFATLAVLLIIFTAISFYLRG